MAAAAKPDTILGWYRKLIANKFDGSKARRTHGRPRIDEEMESLVVRMAKENPSWGYDRIVGALANLGHKLSDQTVGNILRRHDIPPAPKRKHTTSWKDFIRAHLDVLAGTDFFTVEVSENHSSCQPGEIRRRQALPDFTERHYLVLREKNRLGKLGRINRGE